MIPYFNAHLFNIGGVPIEMFGVLVALGIIVGDRIVVRQADKRGIEPRDAKFLNARIVIFGFIMAHLVSVLFYFPERLQENVAWTLLNVVTFWWWEFRLSQIQHWTYGLYFFVCVYASMYYFLSALLFPQDLDEYKGYQDYFLSRRRWFFGFAALTESLDVIDTLIKGEAHLRSLGSEYLVATAAFVLLSAVAARTPNPRFHMLFVLSAVAYEISFSIRHFSTLD